MPVGDPEFDAFRPDSRRFARVRFDAISEAWALYKERRVVRTLTGLVVIVTYGLITAVFGIPRPDNPGGFRAILRPKGSAIQAALGLIVTGFFVGGMIRMACRQIRGLPFEVGTLFSITDVLPSLVIGTLLSGLACAVGLFFLFFPGLVIFGLLMFTLPLIVDAGLPPTVAIVQSWHALKGQWVSATLFHLAIWLLASLGALCCCAGVLITAPLYSLSIAVLYRDFFLAKGFPTTTKPTSFGDDF